MKFKFLAPLFISFLLFSGCDVSSKSSNVESSDTSSSVEPSHPIEVKVGSDSYKFDDLEESFGKVKQLIKESTSKIDVEVSLDEGKFVIKDTITLDGKEFVGKDYSIKVTGNNSTITSAITLNSDDLEDYGFGQYSYQIPDSYKVDGKYPSIRNLLIDSKMAKMAKTDKYVLAYDVDEFYEDGTTRLESDDKIIYLHKALLEGMDDDSIKDAELCIENAWNFKLIHLEKIDKSRNKTDSDGNVLYAVKIRDNDFDVLVNTGSTSSRNYNETLEGCKYWIQNNDFYMEEGVQSYVYKYDEGKVYFQLEDEDVENHLIELPMLNTLVRLDDISNVSFDGVTFTGTTNTFVMNNHYLSSQAGQINVITGEYAFGFLKYGVIAGDNVTDFNLENCSIVEYGTDGINFTGAVERINIKSNKFIDGSGSAIRLSDVSGNSYDRSYDEENHYLDITIENNYICRTGLEFLNSPALVVWHSRNTKILNNTILHSSYSGMSIGWGWRIISDEATNSYNVEIAYNRVEGFMENLQDGGAIYVVGGNASYTYTGYFNSIHDNYVIATEDTTTTNYTCIYLDGSTTNYDVYKNVIDCQLKNTPKMSYINFQSLTSQQVYNCRAKENVVIGISEANKIFSGSSTGAVYNNVFEDNYAVLTYEEFNQQYGSYKTIIDSCGSNLVVE